ncbi:hypothetical protein TNCV_3649611 [Trichonephila clavipes]|nr:hypothetical protein TNCV_3649611 [Trichonephila clavipes]
MNEKADAKRSRMNLGRTLEEEGPRLNSTTTRTRIKLKKNDDGSNCIDVAFLGVWTAKQSSIPYQDMSSMRGMAKVVFYVLLSGMMTIGWTIGSGRRGYCALSGWWFFKVFDLAES